ncbi:MAG: hypothetical protein IJV70_07345 [Clostridia bacterium]|nr:hypothetical protein [Clostridia bacterium]
MIYCLSLWEKERTPEDLAREWQQAGDSGYIPEMAAAVLEHGYCYRLRDPPVVHLFPTKRLLKRWLKDNGCPEDTLFEKVYFQEENVP